MSPALEVGLIWGATGAYLLASVAGWIALLWAKERLLRWTLGFVSLGLLVHTVPLIERWVRSGHGPYIAAFEVLSASVWLGLAGFLVLALRRPAARWAAPPILSCCVLLLGWAVLSNPEVRPLPPTFRSFWLIVHVSAAKLAFGAALIAAGLAFAYLVRSRRQPELDLSGWDTLSYRLVGFGFVFMTFMIASGSIWARSAWGSYWSWDTLETWSLVVWVAFGLALHLRLTFRVRTGRRWAWIVVGLLALTVFVLYVASLISPTVHVEFMVS